MELRHLRSFIGVAEQLHFGRAAAQLHIVQSAVSQQILLLEEELGVRLLDRTRHRVALTDAGRVFLPEARKTLVQAEAAARAARAAGVGTVGRLEFGFVDNATWSVLPKILRGFRERYPGVDLQLHEHDRVALLDGVEDGGLDIALIPAPLSRPGLVSKVLLEAPFMVALPLGHPLTDRPQLALEDLAAEPFVMFPAAMQTRLAQIVHSACAAAGFTPRVVQEARQMHTLLALVGAAFGLTLVPEWATTAPAVGIVYRPFAPAIPSYSLLLVWREDSANAAISRFLDLAREV